MLKLNSIDTYKSSSEYFEKKYGDQYKDIIIKLQEKLLESETGNSKFIVFGPEAGIGKSIETDRIIADYFNDFGSRNFLLVKRFKEDVKASTEYINSVCNNNAVALGITSENWPKIKDNLNEIEQFQVVIITHSRYYSLALKPEIRGYFEKGRHTLIMDELVNIPVYIFSEKKYKEILNILPEPLHEVFMGVCRPVFNQINLIAPTKKNHWIHLHTPILDSKTLDNLERQIEANWNTIPNIKVSKVKDFLMCLCLLPTTECLYNRKSFAVVNHKGKLWGLKNNIILDANASIDARYGYAPNIEVESPPKVIDLFQSTLYRIDFNSSKSKIGKLDNYFEEICTAISVKKTELHKTLIVCHKDFEEKLLKTLKKSVFENIGVGDNYKGENIAVAHFGAIIGKNHWRDFNQVWVIATPITPMALYPLHWSFFAQKFPQEDIQMYGTRGKYRFKDKWYEDIRVGTIASEIYQAIRRIDRSGSLVSEIYIVNSDKTVVDKVTEQLKNVQIGEEISLDFRLKSSVIDRKDKEDVALQLVKLIKTLTPGIYPKKHLVEKLGWKNGSNLAKYLKVLELNELVTAGVLQIRNKEIEIMQVKVA